MAELTQLNVTIADYHTIVSDFHHVIDGFESAITGFADTARGTVADRDKTVRDETERTVTAAVDGMRGHLTKARSVLTALQNAQVTGHHGHVTGGQRPGEPLPIGATVTTEPYDRDDADPHSDTDERRRRGEADAQRQRTEIHEDDAAPTAEPAGLGGRDKILTGDQELTGGHEHKLGDAKAVFPDDEAKGSGKSVPPAKA